MPRIYKLIHIGHIMNLGFYIKNLSDDKQIEFASQTINTLIDDQKINDASIFYDGVGFVPYFLQCGMFNSTELWNFKGSLVTMDIECVKKALKIVNDIKIFYYYGWSSIDVFGLLFILNNNINIICNNADEQKTIHRLTGKRADIFNKDNILNCFGG